MSDLEMNKQEQNISEATIGGEEEAERISRNNEPLLSVQNLHTRFDTDEGTVRAADGVSFEVEKGEILGIVGESGCGKSVTSLSLMGLVDSPGYIADGSVMFDGVDLTELSQSELRKYRGSRISMVFQEPSTAMNPVYNIGWQVGEPLRIHEDLQKEASRTRAIDLMRQVGIPSPEDRVDDYPHQFSGGMLQRAVISMALACEPDLLIADEPTTALDVTIQAQILDIIKELNEELDMSVVIVTHNLGVVAETCDRLAVMYAGRIVEYGTVDEIFNDPRHPYTQGLIEAVPDPTRDGQKLSPISGTVPSLASTPKGCNFESRCPYATEDCSKSDPRLREVDDRHFSACIFDNPT
ncbi:ABC transporter ATP-binding protein [Natronosalvus rutilus]|uniref:Nickel import system ATP-binding protein NikD n=1 Tax=Natronosalvus rutilus TaxID=2953753 RepID=A0A9E7SWQ0_9EURY|nr:ABC transporter ATP-binding protein [Natronosalvus rutilus]UTF55705.1 ABC transporter ATP-binding protein [Natronosalvus rutilus]